MVLILGCHSVDEELPAGLVVLDEVTVVDADGARADRAVLLRDGAVWDVREAGGAWPSDAEVRVGGTVIPGLVDSHMHLAHSGTLEWVGDTLEANLRGQLYHGVTQVVDVGGPTVLFAVRDAIDAGTLLGPRMLATGPFLTVVGSHPCETWPDPDLCVFVTAEDASDAVDSLGDADALKVALADAAFTPWGETPRLSLDALRVITGGSLPVIAHVDTDEDVIDAVGAGVSVLGHPPFAAPIGQEALEAASGMAVHTTVGAFQGVADVAAGISDPALPPEVAEAWAAFDEEDLLPGWMAQNAEWADNVRANLPLLRDAGARVIPGSDAGYYFVPHGLGLHTELRAMVAAGWTPLEALTAATVDAREVWGLPGGRVGPGTRDLVVVDGDPTESVEVLDAIQAIVRDGALVERDAILTMELGGGDGFCLDDEDCACDRTDRVCRPACDEGCGPEAWCMPADGLDATTGVCHPEVACDLYAQDCEPAYYGQACLPYDVDTNACWYGGPRQVGESCTWENAETACEPGLFCSWIDGSCYELCDPAAADDCPGGSRCFQQETADGEAWFGLCL